MVEKEWYSDGLKFSCTRCGNCCTGPAGYVWFTEAEAGAMAGQLGVEEAEFFERYAHQINGRWSLNEVETGHGHDCVFLERDGGGKAMCGIYSVRPSQCRSWPFWPENLKSEGAWRRAGERCPGMSAGSEGMGKFYSLQQIQVIRDGGKKVVSGQKERAKG